MNLMQARPPISHITAFRREDAMRSEPHFSLRQLAVAALFACAAVTSASSAPIEKARVPAADWRSLTHEKLGFEIAYPASVFQPTGEATPDAGRILVSRDGAAKLLIGALDNEEGSSLDDYRSHVLATSYAGASIDYAPVRRSWFVLSGTRNGTMFYERVSFTCNGRRITSWAMLYPAVERVYYDAILEQIARSFRPSRVAEGNCETPR